MAAKNSQLYPRASKGKDASVQLNSTSVRIALLIPRITLSKVIQQKTIQKRNLPQRYRGRKGKSREREDSKENGRRRDGL